MGKVIGWTAIIAFLIASILGAQTIEVAKPGLSNENVQINIQFQKELDRQSFSR